MPRIENFFDFKYMTSKELLPNKTVNPYICIHMNDAKWIQCILDTYVYV